MPEDLIKRAKFAAEQCDAQGFYATAQSLRDLAVQMEACVPADPPGTDAKQQQPETPKPLSPAGS